MLKAFSIIYSITIAFIGCENIYIPNNAQDINVFAVFLSLAFLCNVYVLKGENNTGNIEWGYLPITLLGFLFYSAINFCFSSNADLSIYPAFKILGAIFLTLALTYFLQDVETLKKALLIVFILAATHAVFGIWQQFVPALLHQQSKFNSTSTSFFSNPNYFSGYLVIHIPLGFYLMSHAISNIKRLGLVGLWIMIWIALGFSGSPGGQLIAGLQVFAMILYSIYKKDYRNLKILGWSLFIAFMAYFVLIKFIIGVPLPGSEVIQDSLVRRNWTWGHLENRFMYWAGAWSIFKDHWLFGSGLWTFVELYPQTGLNYTPPHAHNAYLQTLAETGLVGFSFLMICLIVLFRNIGRIFRKASSEVVDLCFYLSVSLCGFLLHNAIEYNWLISNFIYVFVFLIISIEVLNRELQIKESLKLQQYLPKTVPVIIVIGIFAIYQYYSYHRVINEIMFSQTIEEISSNVTEAKTLCARCGKPYYLSGIANLEEFRRSQNNRYLIQAENDFKDVLRLNPNGLGTYLMLGETKGLQGEKLKAKHYFEKALKDPRYRNAALDWIGKFAKAN